MDNFDHINNNQMNTKNIFEEKRNKILEDKQSVIFDFFSNTKSLILLIITILYFGLTLITTVSGWINNSITFEILIQNLASIAISGLLPIALIMIYVSSKRKNNETIGKGLNLARVYFVILNILLIIIAAITVIIFILMLGRLSFGFFLGFLLFGFGLILGFYLVKIFKDFIMGLKSSFGSYRSSVPSSRRIVNALFVVTIFTFIIYLIVLIGFDSLISNIADYAVSIGIESSEVGELITLLREVNIALYYSVAGIIVLEVFIIYYFNSFDKQFTSYNKDLRKKVKALRDAEYLEYKNQ